MKKKLLSVLMAAVLSISLVACGGEETTEAPAAETTVEAGDYTEEQIAFIEEYQKLIDEGLLPVPKFGKPEDVAKMVLACCSGLLDYSAGQVLNADGGFALRRL
jgi:NAD(P)-dependent dehydrogenase (short-subunit alcohol dehydrogenase family)